MRRHGFRPYPTGWVSLRLIAHVPLAGEVRRVAILPEEFGNGRRLLPEEVRVARSDHDRQGGPDWQAPRQK